MAVSIETVESKFTLTRHRVRQGIQKMIMQGQCQPGEKLTQQKLAQKFQVGQGVVREALLELQMSGLVKTFDNRGVFVSELSTNTLLEAYHVREMHEGLAVRLCCEHMTRSEVRKLRGLAENIYERGVEGKLKEMGKW